MKTLFFALIFFSLTGITSAQKNQSGRATCFQPFSYKFDEFKFAGYDDANQHLKAFEKKLSDESGEARGFIYIYGGRKSRVKEIDEIMENFKKVLNISADYFKSKFWIYNGGYRISPTVELFVKPLECSEYPTGISDIGVEQIEFAEAQPDKTVKKSIDEIAAGLVKKIEPVCPPAAKAVRACNDSVDVYVIIDEKGDVIFSRAVAGHPLLKAASEATVKNWKFNPTLKDGKKYNAVGVVRVEFKENQSPIVDY